jgi:hypothetical protein
MNDLRTLEMEITNIKLMIDRLTIPNTEMNKTLIDVIQLKLESLKYIYIVNEGVKPQKPTVLELANSGLCSVRLRNALIRLYESGTVKHIDEITESLARETRSFSKKSYMELEELKLKYLKK